MFVGQHEQMKLVQSNQKICLWTRWEVIGERVPSLNVPSVTHELLPSKLETTYLSH